MKRQYRKAGASSKTGKRHPAILGRMRGNVTLAAAFAIPETLQVGSSFLHRNLILLCAFAVALGTLAPQKLTMKPLIRWLGLSDDDPGRR